MNAVEAHTASLAPKFADLVLNALPHPVLMIGADGRIADANVAAEDFFEVSLPVLRRHLLRDQLLEDLGGIVAGFPSQTENVAVILLGAGEHEPEMAEGLVSIALQ